MSTLLESVKLQTRRTFDKALVTTAAVALFATGCGGQAAQSPPEPNAESSRSGGPPIALSGTSFVIETCPDAKKMDSRAAEGAMRKLIDPCSHVREQSADFLATLVPGGRIEITSSKKDSTEGVVPVCILKNQLTHSVALKQRCTFHIKLGSAAALSDAGSRQPVPPR
jgi:hypothetical protein